MSFISKEEAREMISKYQELRPDLLKEEFPVNILPISLTVPKEEVIKMLDQEGAVSLKIYFGMTGEGNLIDTVLFAADDENNDIAPDTDYLIIDKSTRVP